MKKINLLAIIIASLSSLSANAQSYITIGGGMQKPGADAKALGLNQNQNVNIGFYGSLWQKGIVSIGINSSAGWSKQSSASANGLDSLKPFAVLNSTSDNLSSNSSGSTSNPGFKMTVGPQINFKMGNFMISPVIGAAYISQSLSGQSATQTTVWNGQTLTKDLYNRHQSTTNGFGFNPKLRLQYLLGKIGLWVEGDYLAGPQIKTTETTFKPAGNAVKDNRYEYRQIETGKFTTTEKVTKFTTMGINAGLVFSLGSQKHAIKTKGTGASANRGVDFNSSRSNKDKSALQKSPGQDFNSTRSNKDRSALQQSDENTGSETEAQKNEKSSSPKQTQGNTFGEKVNSGLSTTTTDKSINEKGIPRTEAPEPNAKSINEKGIKKNEVPEPNAKSINEKGIKKNEAPVPAERKDNNDNDSDCDAVKDKKDEDKKVIDVIVLEPESLEIVGGPVFKSINEKGIKRQATPVEGKQTQGKAFGEKVNNGLQAVSVKNLSYSSNGIFTTNDMGKKAFAIIPANFSLQGINTNSGMPNRISMNVTVAKQTQGATFGERLANWDAEHSEDAREYFKKQNVFNISVDEPGVNRMAPTQNNGIAIDEPGKIRPAHTGDPHENLSEKAIGTKGTGASANKNNISVDEPGVNRMASSFVTLYSTIIKSGIGTYSALGTIEINGQTYPVKVTLKTKHDTAKNSVSNIR